MSINIEPLVERKPFKQVVTNGLIKVMFKEVLADERKKKDLIRQIESALVEEKEIVLALREKKKKLLQSKTKQEDRLVKLELFLTKLKTKTLLKDEVISEMKQLLDS